MNKPFWAVSAVLLIAIAGLAAMQEKIADLEECNARQRQANMEQALYGWTTHLDAAEDETRWPTVRYSTPPRPGMAFCDEFIDDEQGQRSVPCDERKQTPKKP